MAPNSNVIHKEKQPWAAGGWQRVAGAGDGAGPGGGQGAGSTQPGASLGPGRPWGAGQRRPSRVRGPGLSWPRAPPPLPPFLPAWGPARTHLPVGRVLPALAGRAGPVLVPGAGAAVVGPLPLRAAALLLRRRRVVVVVVVPVPPVLGPAPLLLPFFRRQVPRLGGHAQVCPQAWAGRTNAQNDR